MRFGGGQELGGGNRTTSVRKAIVVGVGDERSIDEAWESFPVFTSHRWTTHRARRSGAPDARPMNRRDVQMQGESRADLSRPDTTTLPRIMDSNLRLLCFNRSGARERLEVFLLGNHFPGSDGRQRGYAKRAIPILVGKKSLPSGKPKTTGDRPSVREASLGPIGLERRYARTPAAQQRRGGAGEVPSLGVSTRLIEDRTRRLGPSRQTRGKRDHLRA